MPTPLELIQDLFPTWSLPQKARFLALAINRIKVIVYFDHEEAHTLVEQCEARIEAIARGGTIDVAGLATLRRELTDLGRDLFGRISPAASLILALCATVIDAFNDPDDFRSYETSVKYYFDVVRIYSQDLEKDEDFDDNEWAQRVLDLLQAPATAAENPTHFTPIFAMYAPWLGASEE